MAVVGKEGCFFFARFVLLLLFSLSFALLARFLFLFFSPSKKLNSLSLSLQIFFPPLSFSLVLSLFAR